MQITSAMKMVSAAKLKRAQDAITQMRPFAEKFNAILTNVSANAEVEDHSLMNKSEGNNILLIALSSNRGLCGGFNSNIVKAIKKTVAQNPEKNYSVLTIGKKVNDAFKSSDIINNHELLPKETEKIWDDLNYEKATYIVNDIIASFQKGVFDEALLIYNSFKNAAVQELKIEDFLPVIASNDNKNSNVDYLFEPDKEEILKELVPKSLKIQLYKALLDSFASEHGSRMTAMHKATDNATEMVKELTLFYNKARQAAITGEILEIVAGAEALDG